MIADDAFEELPEHEPAWAALDRITAYRKQLLASGYSPVPVNGKRVHLDDWTNIRATNAIIDTWAITRADHLNTGVLCRDTPFIDIDVTVEEVAEEIEALLESEIENSAVRIGLPPKRAIPFRADAPFKKIATQIQSTRTARFTKLKFSATASRSSSTAFIPIRTSPIAGMAASRGPSYGAKTCR